MEPLTIIGGGLAGAEAAWQAARLGVDVVLYEMRPEVMTPAHTGSNLAELVCSNSLGSILPDRAPGLLKAELKRMGSLIVECAEATQLPAGGALAVDREMFSGLVTERIQNNPRIRVVREEIREIPAGTCIVASGPLTSPALSEKIGEMCGEGHLYFYDAIAPVVQFDSIDMEIAYRASRYGRGEIEEGDYINCPFDEAQYEKFVDELISAERIPLREFEAGISQGVRAGGGKEFFEGCLPVEVLAKRGRQSLAFGPLRPIGLRDPRTGRRPHAVAQLRQDNLAGTLYNIVGFQTNLRAAEQERVFRLIPGLEKAKFVRFGQMHRNTYIQSPKLIDETLQFRKRGGLFFAGQITGVEGYMGNVASGLLAGMNAARFVQGKDLLSLPVTTMTGALCYYVSHAEADHFQPMKANFGILPPLGLEGKIRKAERATRYVSRALEDLERLFAK